MWNRIVCVKSFLKRQKDSKKIECLCRNSRQGFFEKDFMRDFEEFTRNRQYQNLFFDEAKLCSNATALKTSPLRRCFLVNFMKFVRTPFFLDYHWMTGFDYSSINCSNKRIGEPNCKILIQKLKHMYKFEPEV